MLTLIPITPEQHQAGLLLHLRRAGLPPDPEPHRCLVCNALLYVGKWHKGRPDAKYCQGCQLDHVQPARAKARRARLKASIALLGVIITLLLPAISRSQGNLGSNSSPVVNRQGIPIGGASISVCQPLATTAASVTSNLATLTMTSNPVTAGFVPGMSILVSGFIGGDTYYNAGTLTNGKIVSGWTILTVSPTTIVFQLVHANASASTNGTVLQEGNGVTPCAGLSSIFQDPALSIPAINPTTSDQLGNWNVFAASGIYYVQFYSPTIIPTVKIIGVSLPSLSGLPGLALNNTWVGSNSFSSSSSFSGLTTFTGTITCTVVNARPCVSPSNPQLWAGTDVGGWINSAYASGLGSTGGTIDVAASPTCYAYSTPILLNTNGKPVYLKGQGVPSTCLQYTPNTGIALTIDTGASYSINGSVEDLELIETSAGATATGISVGPSNGCVHCKVKNATIIGFQTETLSNANSAKFSDVVFGACSSAASSVALQVGGSADDNKVEGGQAFNCATLVNITNSNPVWIEQLLMANASSVWVSDLSSGIFHCVECHWFNQAAGVVTNWFTSNGVTDIASSHFEDARTTGSPTSFATQTGGQLMFNHNYLATYGGETATEFVAFSGGAIGSFVGNTNINSAAVPLLWNAGYTPAPVAVGNVSTAGESYVNSVTTCGTIATNGGCTNVAGQKAHCVAGIATLSGGTSTITGLNPAFTSSSTFFVSTNDLTTIANPSKGVPASGTSITFTGTGTDNISFIACGT